jgi:hypothetical protein
MFRLRILKLTNINIADYFEVVNSPSKLVDKLGRVIKIRIRF